ncbi:hypothetical protein V9T40_012335 [Parthenolecanium corni]|uniref:BHLH domain-containing protein n=1 Tax=Parthenolecanium corni TaxID=536013 RepID=A0AAN9XZD0_9HEMI
MDNMGINYESDLLTRRSNTNMLSEAGGIIRSTMPSLVEAAMLVNSSGGCASSGAEGDEHSLHHVGGYAPLALQPPSYPAPTSSASLSTLGGSYAVPTPSSPAAASDVTMNQQQPYNSAMPSEYPTHDGVTAGGYPGEPKPPTALFADSYYLDANGMPVGGDPWAPSPTTAVHKLEYMSPQSQQSPYGVYTSSPTKTLLNSSPAPVLGSHTYQHHSSTGASTLGTLPPENIDYSALSLTSTSDVVGSTGAPPTDVTSSPLPPVSSLRVSSSISHSSSALQDTSMLYHPHHQPHHQGYHNSLVDTPGVVLGKALTSIYMGPDQSPNSFSSSPSTPVNSPPLSSMVGGRNAPLSHWSTIIPQSHPSASHFGRSTIADDAASVDVALGYIRHHREGAHVEETIDDAINVLRNHAENQQTLVLQPMQQHSAMPPTPTISLPPMYQHLSNAAGLSVPSIGTYQSLNVVDDAASVIKSEKLLTSASKKQQRKDVPTDLLDVKMSTNGATEHLLNNSNSANHNSSTSSMSPSMPASGVGSMVSCGKGTKRSRKYCSSADEDGDDPLLPKSKERRSQSGGDEEEDPVQKVQRERERRQANNARERIRIRDINEALKELGRMCQSHLKQDKPQTKLGILNMAVDVIMSLEQQVRERNLNPKAACLKRREEEKAEDTMGHHHLGAVVAQPPPPQHSMIVSSQSPFGGLAPGTTPADLPPHMRHAAEPPQ